MAASANPSGSGGGGVENNTNTDNVNSNSGNGGTAVSVPPDNSIVGPTQAALRHNPGISPHWTNEEQSLLEELLIEYESDASVMKYSKIAMKLENKTVRDVALRCRWMTKKENSKRRKEDHNALKKNKEKKKVTDSAPKSSQVAANRSSGGPSSHAQSSNPQDNDDGVSFQDIGGTAGQLLEQNARALEQIDANFKACKINDNVRLFGQTRNNIKKLLNDFDKMPNVMKQMPPLPVKLNDAMADEVVAAYNASLAAKKR